MELADTSAWTSRVKNPEVRSAFDELIETGRIATCDMVALELLWSTRDARELRELRKQLGALTHYPMGMEVWRRATDVFEALARRGPLHHRQVKLPDLLIAATAEVAGLPVCHYDRDFEIIAAVTGQPVRAIAELGTL